MDDSEDRLDDLYAILNVSRDASSEEITKAYRKLAFVFHPDKHQSAHLKEGAQEAFSKLQEAYEVLSNETKRQVYDIYGRQGLTAGFEVGDRLHSREELKKEWEDFKLKQEQQKAESSTVIKGLYQCRIDATEPLRRGPVVRSIVVTNSAAAAVGEGGDNIHLQGQAAVRNQAGSGNIVFGYTRLMSPHDTLEGMVVLGLRSLGTLTSTRQIGANTTANATMSWGPQDGLGLQLGSTRQLPYGCTGTNTWVLGPKGATGMTLQVTRKGTGHVLQGKVEVGAVTSLSARATLMVTKAVALRAVVRLGTTGVDVEVGASNRFSQNTNGYLGTQVGLMGVVVKARVTRSNQTLEFPIVLSNHWDDWKVAIAATVVPPVLYLASSRLIVRPLIRWHRSRAERLAREQYAEEMGVGLKAAANERSLLAPVATRKARIEASRKGLVILEAAYGVIPEYHKAVMAERQAMAAGGGSGAAGTPAGTTTAIPTTGPAVGPSTTSVETATIAEEGGSSAVAAVAVDVPKWLRVTEALQYLVVDSKLVLHSGVSKSGLMGFVDPAPGAAAGGATKQLYIAYLHGGGTVREAVFDDLSGIELPSAADQGDAGGGAPPVSTPPASSVTPGLPASPSMSFRSPGLRSASRATGVRILPTDVPAYQSGGANGGGGGTPLANPAAAAQVQSAHPRVEDVGHREWLLRQGADCLGLDMTTLMAGFRDASEQGALK